MAHKANGSKAANEYNRSGPKGKIPSSIKMRKHTDNTSQRQLRNKYWV
jgi:hypothetical protein